MTARERISIIRLSEKINKKPEYAKLLGISVVDAKADCISKSANQSSEIKKTTR